MNKEAILEGLLFIAGSDGLTIKKITDILETTEAETIKLINILREEYKKDNRGIEIQYLGNSFKLTTKSIHKDFYKNLVLKEDTNILSQSALETLAIIAYNEPITRNTVNEIRGVDSTHIIRKLLVTQLIKEAGKSDLPGRPMLYETTDKFLDYFGLKNKDELPKLETEEENIEETDLFNSKYSEIL